MDYQYSATFTNTVQLELYLRGQYLDEVREDFRADNQPAQRLSPLFEYAFRRWDQNYLVTATRETIQPQFGADS